MVLSTIIERGLAISGRLGQLKVQMADEPGALAEVTKILGASNANIVEVRHQRAFTHLSLRSVEVGFVIQSLGMEHAQQVVAVLIDEGFPAKLAG